MGYGTDYLNSNEPGNIIIHLRPVPIPGNFHGLGWKSAPEVMWMLCLESVREIGYGKYIFISPEISRTWVLTLSTIFVIVTGTEKQGGPSTIEHTLHLNFGLLGLCHQLLCRRSFMYSRTICWCPKAPFGSPEPIGDVCITDIEARFCRWSWVFRNRGGTRSIRICELR